MAHLFMANSCGTTITVAMLSAPAAAPATNASNNLVRESSRRVIFPFDQYVMRAETAKQM
jgi:hypothetical protein